MGPARIPQRTNLLLTEMDDALRRAERDAASGDAHAVARHFAAHVRAGGEPREFFTKELEGYHKAHDEWREANRVFNTSRTDHPEHEQRRVRLHAAHADLETKGKVLAAKAHATDHPVGQYLDWRGPSSRILTRDIHTALHHVSHNPTQKPGHGYGTFDHQTGEREWQNADEKSARHLEHAIKAHGFQGRISRGRDNLVRYDPRVYDRAT